MVIQKKMRLLIFIILNSIRAERECLRRQDPKGLYYRGRKNVTRAGLKCVARDGKEAVCRNSDDDFLPWCFTSFTENSYRCTARTPEECNYGYCDIPACSKGECGKFSSCSSMIPANRDLGIRMGFTDIGKSSFDMALHSERSCSSGEKENIAISKNGHNFKPLRIPWHVGLSIYRGGFIFCGGTLISLDTILTAAHCIEKRPKFASAGHLKRKYRNYRHESSHQIRHLEYENYKHPLFNKTTLAYDLAILKTSEPFGQTSFISPACLPVRKLKLPSFSKCVVSATRM